MLRNKEDNDNFLKHTLYKWLFWNKDIILWNIYIYIYLYISKYIYIHIHIYIHIYIYIYRYFFFVYYSLFGKHLFSWTATGQDLDSRTAAGQVCPSLDNHWTGSGLMDRLWTGSDSDLFSFGMLRVEKTSILQSNDWIVHRLTWKTK